MAQRLILACDYPDCKTPDEDAETLSLSVNGMGSELDLCKKHMEAWVKATDTFFTSSRPVQTRVQTRPSYDYEPKARRGRPRNEEPRQRKVSLTYTEYDEIVNDPQAKQNFLTELRLWGSENNKPVPERGRIKATVIREFCEEKGYKVYPIVDEGVEEEE